MQSAELHPTAEQGDLLRATLERVNRACDEAAKAAFAAGVRSGPGLVEAVRPHVVACAKRFSLRSPYPTLLLQRVADAIAASPGRPPRFRPKQSIVLTADQHKWQGNDRVSLPTWKGRRTIAVSLDPRAGPVPLRHPLQGQPVAFVERSGKLYLDPIGRDDDDDE